MKGICIVAVVVFPKGKNNTTIEIDHAEAIVENNEKQSTTIRHYIREMDER